MKLILSYFVIAFIHSTICTSSPSFYPTPNPTEIPNSFPNPATVVLPIALHQIIVVESGGSAVIRLKGYDQSTPSVIL
jgi:hypothetical protein